MCRVLCQTKQVPFAEKGGSGPPEQDHLVLVSMLARCWMMMSYSTMMPPCCLISISQRQPRQLMVLAYAMKYLPGTLAR